MTAQRTQRPWYGRLEVIAVGVMVVFGVTDIALRFMPLERLAFRPWEAAADHPLPNAPFAALKTYRMRHSYGDLSNSGNLPSLRDYHEEIFSTDELGFRNPAAKVDSRVPLGLLVGTSFSAGSGLNDDQTLSARLSARSQCRVYNAAGPTDFCKCAGRLVSQLNMRTGTVIFELAERNWYPQDYLDCLDAQQEKYNLNPGALKTDYFHRPSPPKSWSARWATWWHDWNKWEADHIPKSRLEIIAVKLYKLLQNDCILPNTPARTTVTSRTLRNGDVMLFPSDQPGQLLKDKDPTWIAAYCNWFANEMQKRNLDLIVVLVPEKFTAYLPFFSIPETDQEVSPEYLDQVERVLKAMDIPVVNLLPVFRQAAADGLADRRYIYRRDDTHWNPRGVELAADSIPFTCGSPRAATRARARGSADPQTLSVWQDILAKNPQSWAAQYNLAGALLQAGRVEDAIAHFEEALRLDPDNAKVHNNLGVALLEAGRIKDAITHYEQALRIQPDDAEGHYNLGVALMQTGKTEEAIAQYQQALRLNPDNAKAHHNLGNVLLQAGRVQDGIGHYEQALRIDPDYAEAHYSLGNVLVQAGRVQEAMAHYEQVLRINPDHAHAHCNLGTVLARAGKLDEAIQHFEQALRIQPDYAEAHLDLGAALLEAGRIEDAIPHFEQALRIQPDNAGAHSNLGLALAKTGNIEEAIAHYEQALRIKPDYAEAHYNLGLALAQTGNIEEAIAHYEQALRIRPDFPQAQKALARLHAGQ